MLQSACGRYLTHCSVGIGSDFDGIEKVGARFRVLELTHQTPKGLEDVSKYPYLFAELIRRGWTKHEIGGLAGGNILRVLHGAEEVAAKLKKKQGPNMTIYSKRRDVGRGLPFTIEATEEA